MANSYPTKINRSVSHRVSIGGVVRVRPAIITGVVDTDTANLRVGHHGETYAARDRRLGARGALNVNWNDHWCVGG
jgi:hypothetical protein